MNRIIFLAALLLASCSESNGAPDLAVSEAWVRETVAGQSSTAAYLTVTNSGAADDRLTGVAAPPPAQASLHSTAHADGISRMRPAEGGLPIPAGRNLGLKPSGDHIMITSLPASLEPGETLRLTLSFERSGERNVDVLVLPALGQPATVRRQD